LELLTLLRFSSTVIFFIYFRGHFTYP
jgi:hypothetical protein